MDQRAVAFGSQLRKWRRQRQFSQLELALQAEVSTRHLSWLETGRSQPSRAMVLRLAEQLDVPLRERNGLLVAAGFAPLYAERSLAAAESAPVRQALQRLLDAHHPNPALALDRRWNLVAHNRMAGLLLQGVSPALLQTPANALRIVLHPEGLAPVLVDALRLREHMLGRLQRQVAATRDPVLVALLDELRALEVPSAGASEHAADADADAAAGSELDIALPVSVRSPAGQLDFITTLTVFGAPHDLTLSELAVETLLPANVQTAQRLQQLAQTVTPNP